MPIAGTSRSARYAATSSDGENCGGGWCCALYKKTTAVAVAIMENTNVAGLVVRHHVKYLPRPIVRGAARKDAGWETKALRDAED